MACRMLSPQTFPHEFEFEFRINDPLSLTSEQMGGIQKALQAHESRGRRQQHESEGEEV